MTRPSMLPMRCCALLSGVLSACILDADLGGLSELPATSADDAGQEDAPSCALGDAQVCATAGEADSSLLLTVTPGQGTSYFADGQTLPAGDYTLIYQDGCWRSGVIAWTVNLGEEGYWLVGGQPEARLLKAPGSAGTFATLGAYMTYDECVLANRGRSGVSFHFEGGPLGLNLASLDAIAAIQLVGGESVGGRSPTFLLSCTGGPCR